MHHKGQDTSGKYIILHPSVPRRPHLLDNVEVDIVLGDLVELTPIRVRDVGEECC